MGVCIGHGEGFQEVVFQGGAGCSTIIVKKLFQYNPSSSTMWCATNIRVDADGGVYTATVYWRTSVRQTATISRPERHCVVFDRYADGGDTAVSSQCRAATIDRLKILCLVQPGKRTVDMRCPEPSHASQVAAVKKPV